MNKWCQNEFHNGNGQECYSLKSFKKKYVSTLLHLIVYFKVHTLVPFLYVPKDLFRHFLSIFLTLSYRSHMTISNG